MKKINVEKYLEENGIEYVLHEHPAVYTCEDAEKHCVSVPGISCKNLLLKGKKSGQYFLLILPAEKRANLKTFGEITGEKKLDFASAETVREKLGLEPGSVSPFGLLNNETNDIALYIDREVYEAETVNFHPNRNTASLEINKKMFHKFLNLLEVKYQVI